MVGRVDITESPSGRTCRFSVRIGEDPPAPHLYFARTVKWAESSQPMSATRDGATALTDFAGNALYIGGVDQAAIPVAGIHWFDTMVGVFEEVAVVEPRRSGAAAQLGDGRIVIGGGNTTTKGVASDILEVVDLNDATSRAPRDARSGIATALVGSSTRAGDSTSTSDGHVVAFGGAARLPSAPRSPRSSTSAAPDQSSASSHARGSRSRASSTRLPALRRFRRTDLRDWRPRRDGQADRARRARQAADRGDGADVHAEMVKARRDHQAVRLPDGSVLVVGGLDVNGHQSVTSRSSRSSRAFNSRAGCPSGRRHRLHGDAAS